MKLVYAGDAINPCPPNFDLKIDDYTMGMPVGITDPKQLRIEFATEAQRTQSYV